MASRSTIWSRYNHKHNEANGENNRDGGDDNRSWNCGVEGPTDDPEVGELRNRQIKISLTVTILSLGVPMILMGDEVRRHAARQQQRLLPGQRDQLVRLDLVESTLTSIVSSTLLKRGRKLRDTGSTRGCRRSLSSEFFGSQ